MSETNNYQILTGIPLPKKQSVGAGRAMKYPLAEMQVGQTFVFPTDEVKNVRAAAGRYGKIKGKKFSVRKLDDSGFGCWRLA